MPAKSDQKVEQEFVSALKPDAEQPRKTFDEQYLDRLGESLLKRQWYPLLIRPTRVIIDGECRWRAAKLKRIEKLDVIVVQPGTSLDDALDGQLITAFHRADLTAWEQACGFRDWLKKNAGKTARELASRIDRDQSSITKYLAIFDTVQAVQEAAAAGKIGPSQWYQLALTDKEHQTELLEMHLAGIPREQLAEACRKKRAKPAEPTPKASRIRIELAGAVVTIAGDGLDLDSAIEAVGEARKRLKDGKDQGLTAKTISKVSAEQKAKASG
jgi:ParB family chromosome partitioning protein